MPFSLEELQKEIVSAKERALEGEKTRVFDIYANAWKSKHSPNLAMYERLLALESKIVAALKAAENDRSGNSDSTDFVDVGAAELREILEGLEKNGQSAGTTAPPK